MKLRDVTIGCKYKAKVSGRLVSVRVTAIDEVFRFGKSATVIRAVNESTGREIKMRSAQRLRLIDYVGGET